MYKCVCLCVCVCVCVLNIKKISWVELLGDQNLLRENNSRNIGIVPVKKMNKTFRKCYLLVQ